MAYKTMKMPKSKGGHKSMKGGAVKTMFKDHVCTKGGR